MWSDLGSCNRDAFSPLVLCIFEETSEKEADTSQTTSLSYKQL